MRKWLTLSTLLHLLVFLLLWLGLPHFNRTLLEPAQIIPVDIASIKDITAMKKTEPKEEPPKPPEPKPAPTPKPAPDPKPQENKVPEKAEPLPTSKPKPPKPEPPKEQKDPLSSILKNVAKMKDQEKTPPKPEAETKPAPQKEPSPAPTPPQVPATAEHLSINELEALRQQMKICWNPPVGAKNADSLSVDIYISLNPDRTVREAVVVDQARMASDPFFRTMAESALRALHNPHCSPLAMPPEKYDQWKDTVMTFNPKDMF